MKKILFFCAVLFAFSNNVQAQVTTSSIVGTVTQIGGEVVEGASVKAVHTPSGTTYSGMTNASGRFNLANLRVGGPYRVELSFIGMETATYDNIYLQLGQPHVMNVALGEAYNELEGVEIVFTGRDRKSERNGASTVVSRAQIQEMPSISRSVNDFTRLTPQANGTAIGGGNYRANNFTVDGANFNNQFGIGQNIPANGSPISIDAIEQINVNVTPFDVRQSGFTGAAINAVTRSGRNELFGSAFYTGRSDKQQGVRVEDKVITPNEMDEKNFGLSLGGPIIEDKLFFFINVERNLEVRPGPTKIASSPENPFGAGNSNVARPSVDFMNGVRDHLINTYGYDPGAYQGYTNDSYNHKYFTRIDWNISDNHKINFRYNRVESKSPSMLSNSFTGSGLSGLSRTGTNALHFGNSNYFQENNLYSATAEYLGRWGNTNNTIRVSYVNQNEPRSVNGGAFPLVDIKEGDNIITTFGYEPFSYGNLRDVETLTAYWDGNYMTGNHEFTYGLQYETSIVKNGFQRFGAGYYLFDSWDDFVNGNQASNYALTYPMTADGSQAFPSFRFDQYSAFLQDQITLSDKFRVTAGVRFELPTYPNVDEIRTHPLLNGLTFADGITLDTGKLPKQQLMISPRVGFNYDVLGDRSLILRGGSGIFTGRIPYVWIVSQSGDAGLLQASQILTGADVPAFSPDITANYPTTLPEAGTALPASVSVMDPNLKFPSTWKSSLAVDYALPWGINATVEGIYNKDINAVIAKNVNLVDPERMNIAGYGDNRYIYPVANIDRYIHKLDGNDLPSLTGTRQFVPTYLTNADGGHYWSATLQLQKSFEDKFNMSVAYTRSGAKNFGDGFGDQLSSYANGVFNSSGNFNDSRLSYTSNIVPDRVTGFLSYSNNWIGKLNTSVSLFYSGSSTGRISYIYSADFNRDGVSNDLIYIPASKDELVFAPIPANQLSNYGGNSYTPEEQAEMFWNLIEGDDYLRSRKGNYAERNGGAMPWRHQFDMRISQEILKDIAGGKNSLEFYCDIFNVGNLLNSDWGVFKSANNILLRPQNVNALTPDGTTVPTFNIGYANGDAVKSTTFTNETFSSTYYMQFGVRFTF